MAVIWPRQLGSVPVRGFPFWNHYRLSFDVEENDYLYWDRKGRCYIWKKKEGILRIGNRIEISSLWDYLNISTSEHIEGFLTFEDKVVYFLQGKHCKDRHSLWVEAAYEGKLLKVIYNGEEVDVPIGLDAPDFFQRMTSELQVDLLRPPYEVGEFIVRYSSCEHIAESLLVTGFPFVYCSCDEPPMPSLLYYASPQRNTTGKFEEVVDWFFHFLKMLPTEEVQQIALFQFLAQIDYARQIGACSAEVLDNLESAIIDRLF